VVGGLVAVVVLAANTPHFVSSLEKVRPGAAPPQAPGALSLARGECEGLQLYVPPGTDAVRVEAPPLTSAGTSLPVATFEVGYVPVTTPSNAMGKPGPWPDPLLPLSPERALRSRPEQPAVVYLEVCAPEAQRPGEYAGAVRVRRGEQALELSLRATVHPFVLPATSSLPNSFGISLYSIAKGHGVDPATPEALALMHDYVRTLLSHRVTAHGMSMEPPGVRFEQGRAVVDFRAYDAELGPYLEGTALPSGARFTTIDVRGARQARTDAEKTAYYRAFREHLAEKGWRAQPFYYAKDEPRPEDFPLVRQQAARVKRAGGIPVLVTSPHDEALRGAADILTPPLNCFFPREGPPTCRRPMAISTLRSRLPRQARVFWYQSCLAHGCTGGPAEDPRIEQAFSGWASYMVDHPAPLNRAMGPLAWRTRVDGELYFDTVSAYNSQDPWQGVFAFGGNGDGTFFYPGTPARLGGGGHRPVVSLRLKHLRDGLEDYEYLRLLAELGDRAGADALAAQLAPSGFQVSRDPAVWERVRAELTRRLTARWRSKERPGPSPVQK
jgi:Domain of unknown function (DUF4091)